MNRKNVNRINHFTGYTCSLCGAEYGPDEVEYVCPKDGGNLNVVLDFHTIQQNVQIADIYSSTEA